jgi:hypothetical protein
MERLTEGQIDGQDEANNRFSQIVESAEKKGRNERASWSQMKNKQTR